MSVVGPSLLTPVSITMATGGTYAGSVLEAGRSHGVLFDSSHTGADGSLSLSVCLSAGRWSSVQLLPHQYGKAAH